MFSYMVAEPAKVLAPGRSGARWWTFVVITFFLQMATSTDRPIDDFLYDQEHVDFMDYMDEKKEAYEKKDDYERDWNPQLLQWPDSNFLMTDGLTESLGDYLRWMGTTSSGWIGAARWHVKAWIGTTLEEDGSHDPSDYIQENDNRRLAEVEDWRLDSSAFVLRTRIGALFTSRLRIGA